VVDIEARLADPAFVGAVKELTERVMADRVSEGHVPADGPAFEEDRAYMTIEVLTVLLTA